jgi:hypothetical protein
VIRMIVSWLMVGVVAVLSATGGLAQTSTTWWQPTPGNSWQIQLNEAPDISVDADIFDVDLWETPQKSIDTIHQRGGRVICYFSAGSRENWRPDAKQFPANAVGQPLDGWAGGRWLDIRADAVRAIMEQRLDLAQSKNCDAVDPDNVDGYTAKTGFGLTAAEQQNYNLFLANAAHDRGLAVGLKNDVEQIPALVDSFDFAVNEECFRYHECGTLSPFIQSGKAVFQIEYGKPRLARQICPKARQLGFDTLVKQLSLGAQRTVCPAA